MENKKSIEILNHFSCKMCGKWWTIGDAPKTKNKWYCPWCRELNTYKNNKRRN